MSRKWLVIGLVVSLAINLAFAGYFVGRHVVGGYGHRSGWISTTMPFTRLLQPLGEERMHELIPRAERDRSVLREHYAAIRQAQRDIYETMIAEEFDAERFAEQQRQFNELFGVAKARQDATFVEIVSQLSQKERLLITEPLMSYSRNDRHRSTREARHERNNQLKSNQLDEASTPERD